MDPTPALPDAKGRFGLFGGRYIPEVLVPAVEELGRAYEEAAADPSFRAEYEALLADYVGRPNPITLARRLTDYAGGARIWLKREDLNHSGAHKVNNTLGQILLARRMGKPRVIAETGAGMHGVATALACALFNLQCIVYMGEEDVRRQSPNVYRMRLMGAEVRAVGSGTRTLKDAMNEAMRDWCTNVADTFYCIGTVAGPHPYPKMVRDFQAVIGREARAQILEKEGRLPAAALACVGGGSNAMGLFHAFVPDAEVDLIGVEAAGRGIETGEHAASLGHGRVGVLHGSRSYILMDDGGQIREAYSLSAGLDYPGVGPEHSYLKETGRAQYASVTDDEAIEAFHRLSELEGILPALESSHALAHAIRIAKDYQRDASLLVCLSGRGDKDVEQIEAYEAARAAGAGKNEEGAER